MLNLRKTKIRREKKVSTRVSANVYDCELSGYEDGQLPDEGF